MQIIIPMSGSGSRFQEKGYKDPKPLIEVDGYPMIKHVVDLFPNETNIKFICNTEHASSTNMINILKSIAPTSKIYSIMKHKDGPVPTVLHRANEINDDEEVIISYCDYGTYWNYPGFLNDMRNHNADGGIACYTGFHPHMLGKDHYAYVKETNKWAEKIQEKKPFTDNKMNEYASNGTYYFRTGAIMKQYFNKLVNNNVRVNNEFYVSCVYNLMIEDNLKVRVFEIENMLQWGTPFDLEVYKTWSQYFRDIVNYTPSQKVYKGTTILPMAGHGSRFSLVGYTVPKPLLDINGLPMFIQALRCLPKTEKYAFICLQDHLDTYPTSQYIDKYYPNSPIIGLENVTEGQACTCEIGMKDKRMNINNNDPIMITASDNGAFYDDDNLDIMMEDENIDVIVWSFTNNPTGQLYPQMYAWLDVDNDGFIHDVSIKKPFPDKPNKHAIIGTMYFRKAQYYFDGLKDVYERNLRTNGEFYVDAVLIPLIEKGYRVKVFEVKNYLCWGTPNDYKTYLYWRDFFDKYPIHPYEKSRDPTFV